MRKSTYVFPFSCSLPFYHILSIVAVEPFNFGVHTPSRLRYVLNLKEWSATILTFIVRLSGTGSGAGPYIAIHEGFQGVRPFLGYTHNDVLISDCYCHPHSPPFGKGTSHLFRIPLHWRGFVIYRIHWRLLSYYLASSRALTALHWISTQWVNSLSASVNTRKYWMVNWTTVHCYLNLVLGIHRRYYLDVGLPRFLWLVMFGLTHYLVFIRPDQMAAKPWYVIPCPISINLMSPFGDHPWTSLTSIFQWLGCRHESIPKSIWSYTRWRVLQCD